MLEEHLNAIRTKEKEAKAKVREAESHSAAVVEKAREGGEQLLDEA
jgi:vacuolar-type H+-ATPase subunit H